MSADIIIRPAAAEDAEALLNIYAPYVERTAVTFEYTIPSLAEFRDRIINISSRYPYLGAWKDGLLMGYAYASPFKGRAAYDWSVETSIYVSENARRSGIGTALYQRLEELLKKQNICNLCACITYPNPESIAFHEKFGYTAVAHFHKSGYKLGAWYDMIWMEKFINEHQCSPKTFVPIKEVL